MRRPHASPGGTWRGVFASERPWPTGSIARACHAFPSSTVLRGLEALEQPPVVRDEHDRPVAGDARSNSSIGHVEMVGRPHRAGGSRPTGQKSASSARVRSSGESVRPLRPTSSAPSPNFANSVGPRASSRSDASVNAVRSGSSPTNQARRWSVSLISVWGETRRPGGSAIFPVAPRAGSSCRCRSRRRRLSRLAPASTDTWSEPKLAALYDHVLEPYDRVAGGRAGTSPSSSRQGSHGFSTCSSRSARVRRAHLRGERVRTAPVGLLPPERAWVCCCCSRLRGRSLPRRPGGRTRLLGHGVRSASYSLQPPAYSRTCLVPSSISTMRVSCCRGRLGRARRPRWPPGSRRRSSRGSRAPRNRGRSSARRGGRRRSGRGGAAASAARAAWRPRGWRSGTWSRSGSSPTSGARVAARAASSFPKPSARNRSSAAAWRRATRRGRTRARP